MIAQVVWLCLATTCGFSSSYTGFHFGKTTTYIIISQFSEQSTILVERASVIHFTEIAVGWMPRAETIDLCDCSILTAFGFIARDDSGWGFFLIDKTKHLACFTEYDNEDYLNGSLFMTLDVCALLKLKSYS